MRPALANVSSLSSPLSVDVEDYAAGQCRAIEVWLTKLEDYLAGRSLDALRELLARHDVSFPVASFQGGLLDTQGEARRLAWELFAKRLELCQTLGIGTLVVACDVKRPFDAESLARTDASLRLAARQASDRGVRLALEFQADAAFGNNLLTAAMLVDEIGHPALGLCLDAFHYYVGPSQAEDLACLRPDNLFHVQLCDLSLAPRELAADGQRILPGDGDIPLGPVVARLREIGYAGHVSVELLNPRLWQVPARQFGEIALTALRKVLGLASMEDARSTGGPSERG